jgi:hypothetical protein
MARVVNLCWATAAEPLALVAADGSGAVTPQAPNAATAANAGLSSAAAAAEAAAAAAAAAANAAAAAATAGAPSLFGHAPPPPPPWLLRAAEDAAADAAARAMSPAHDRARQKAMVAKAHNTLLRGRAAKRFRTQAAATASAYRERQRLALAHAEAVSSGWLQVGAFLGVRGASQPPIFFALCHFLRRLLLFFRIRHISPFSSYSFKILTITP